MSLRVPLLLLANLLALSNAAVASTPTFSWPIDSPGGSAQGNVTGCGPGLELAVNTNAYWKAEKPGGPTGSPPSGPTTFTMSIIWQDSSLNLKTLESKQLPTNGQGALVVDLTEGTVTESWRVNAKASEIPADYQLVVDVWASCQEPQPVPE